MWAGMGMVDYGLVENDNGGLSLVPLYDGIQEEFGAVKFKFLNYIPMFNIFF